LFPLLCDVPVSPQFLSISVLHYGDGKMTIFYL
jgi:hypothetical protein